MTADHIEYLRGVVEGITLPDGNPAFVTGSGETREVRFFEIALKPGELKRKLPCAVLSHQLVNYERNGSFSAINRVEGVITRSRKIMDSEKVYQVSFYTKDIYNIIEMVEDTAEETAIPFAEQMINAIAEIPFFVTRRNRGVEVEITGSGLIDEEEIITDGIYMSYVQIRFKDGIYKDSTAPAIDEATIEDGGIS